MNKKGKGGMGWPVVVLIIAAAILFYSPIEKALSGAGAPAEEPIVVTPVACAVEDTTLGFSLEDKDAPGATLSINARYWVDGKPQGVVNTSGSATVSPADTIDIWFAASDTTYYGSYVEGEVIPCKGTYDISGLAWTQDDSSGVTMTIFDENDNAQSAGANNQSIGTGETVTLKLRVKGTHEEYFGNPEVALDNLLAVEYHRTQYDWVEMEDADGVALETATVPAVEGVSSTDNTEIGFLMPKVSGSRNVDYFVTIKADDLTDPTGDIIFKIYDADYFYNSNTGKIEIGWQDQNNADIGETTEPTVTAIME